MTVEGADTHYYTKQFSGAAAVAEYLGRELSIISSEQTLLWKNTWYDSTLPQWFLERTLMNISAWPRHPAIVLNPEGFMPGKAWAVVMEPARTYISMRMPCRGYFPELERDERERVDLGIGYDEATGMIRIRGEKTGPSIDGQAGTILRIYREYFMSC